MRKGIDFISFTTVLKATPYSISLTNTGASVSSSVSRYNRKSIVRVYTNPRGLSKVISLII